MRTGYNRKVMQSQSVNIPDVRLFGYNRTSKVLPPMPMHTHGDCIEIVIVIKGSEIYHAGGTAYTLHGGQAFISNVNEGHRNEYNQGISEFIWLQIHMSDSRSFLGNKTADALRLKEIIRETDTHVYPVRRQMMTLIMDAYQAAEQGRGLLAGALLTAFLDLMFITCADITGNRFNIMKAVEYIHAHIEEEILFEDICRYAGISMSSLKHGFKEITGRTPRNYINEMKITKAAELLKGGMSVTDTAHRLAFNSSDYFSVVFKRHTNMTPSEFLQEGFRERNF